MITDLDALVTFVEIADRGGFAPAARHLGISRPVATRRVQRLERELGAALLHRTTRGLAMTEAGRAFHARCRSLLGELEDACEEAAGGAAAAAGAVRLTASPTFACALVAPVVAGLAASHPEIELEVVFDDRRFDSTGEGFDLALRAGALQDRRVIARQLAVVDGAVVASRDYLEAHGTPRTPSQLAAHVCLDHAELSPHGLWRFHGAAPVRMARRIRMNSFEALRELAVRGVGIAALPSFMAREAGSRGDLVRILARHRLVEHPLSLVFRERRLAPKVRTVVEAFVSYARRPVVQWGA